LRRNGLFYGRMAANFRGDVKSYKVFGIGFNRTGTTSLKRGLRALGYKALVKNGPYLRALARDDMAWIFQNMVPYNGFQDWPWPRLYPQMLAHFGDRARFVLTRRASAEKWVASLKRHSERISPDSHPRLAMLGFEYPHGLETEHAALYEAHIQQVRRFFREAGKQDQLCEICWETGDGWPELCGFLNEPIPTRPFLPTNRSADAQPDPDHVAGNWANIERQLKMLAASGPRNG